MKTILSAVELTAELVRIPSLNTLNQTDASDPRFGESGMIAFLKALLAPFGCELIDVPVPDHAGNLVALFNGVGPGADRAPLMFEAHMDTVQVENMTIAPFDPVIHDGKLYGRGACDTKGPMATMIHAVVSFILDHLENHAPIMLVFVCDEEATMTGSESLRKWMDEQGIVPAGIVVMEPTECKLVVANKGCLRFFVETVGRACHAAIPEDGDNAVYAMAPILDMCRTFHERLRAQPPHPALGTRTLSVGGIRGGSAANIVPDKCAIEIDARLLPGDDPEKDYLSLFDAELKRFPTASRSDMYLRLEGWEMDVSHPFIGAMSSACEDAGVHPELEYAQYCTDMCRLGRGEPVFPAVVFGPGAGAQAHTRDEFIDMSELDKAGVVLLNLLGRLAI